MGNKSAKCWICGAAEADSAEHLFKKTDIHKNFGKGAFTKPLILTHLEDRSESFVQGPDSDYLKFEKNICKACNTKATQPYDLAYDIFEAYIRENHKQLRQELTLSFNEVYGKKNAKKEQANLFRYFIKIYGCLWCQHGLPPPKEFTAALNGSNFLNSFSVSICLDDKISTNMQKLPFEGGKDGNGNPVANHFALDNGVFTVVYAYNYKSKDWLGERWFGKSRRIALGGWWKIPDELRDELDAETKKLNAHGGSAEDSRTS